MATLILQGRHVDAKTFSICQRLLGWFGWRCAFVQLLQGIPQVLCLTLRVPRFRVGCREEQQDLEPEVAKVSSCNSRDAIASTKHIQALILSFLSRHASTSEPWSLPPTSPPFDCGICRVLHLVANAGSKATKATKAAAKRCAKTDTPSMYLALALYKITKPSERAADSTPAGSRKPYVTIASVWA